jgi:hypothetical protein
VILYNLLSAYTRVGLPEEFHSARPTPLPKVVRHACETLGRPANDLDREGFGLIHETAVTHETVIAGGDEGRQMNLPHTGRRHIGDLAQIDFHGDLSPIDGGSIEYAFMPLSA